MDIAAIAPSAPQDLPGTTVPWENRAAKAQRPFRRAARGISRPDSAPVQAEPIPQGVVVLTLATAVLVAFGARVGSQPDSRVVTFAATELAD